MGLIDFVLKAFGGKRGVEKKPNDGWLKGQRALESGRQHLIEGRNQEALACFDLSIACGLDDGELRMMRGMCLQALDWHLDAIDEFTKSILMEEEEEDANLFYIRAMSRVQIGDEEGFRADIQHSVRLSKSDNSLNRSYNQAAVEKGYRSASDMFEHLASLFYDQPGFMKEERIARTRARGRRGSISSD